MGFLSHRGSPSHHPFLDGIFHEINHPFSSDFPIQKHKIPAIFRGQPHGADLCHLCHPHGSHPASATSVCRVFSLRRSKDLLGVGTDEPVRAILVVISINPKKRGIVCKPFTTLLNYCDFYRISYELILQLPCITILINSITVVIDYSSHLSYLLLPAPMNVHMPRHKGLSDQLLLVSSLFITNHSHHQCNSFR